MKDKKKALLKDNIELQEKVFKISVACLMAVVFLVCFFSCGGTKVFEKTNYVDNFKNYEFQIHTIDVENGDAFLLKLPDNKTMLIDCGEEKYQTRVISYIKQFLKHENLSQIDYFVMTHSDSDHVGNAGAIIEKFDVKNVYRPKIYAKDEMAMLQENKGFRIDDGKAYNRAILSAYNNDCNIIFSQAGLTISLKNCSIEFLSPSLNNYSEDNDYSAVLMIKYYASKFLFMGDASSEIENALIAEFGNELQADVLKVGHHGSKTSTSEKFLSVVKPKYAILSCSDNSGILPSSEVVARLQSAKIEILSTSDLQNFGLTVIQNNVVYKGQSAFFNFWVIIFVILMVLIIIMFKFQFFDKNDGKYTKKR